jgi:outer membrane protein OmpA-like peptidoglycan-associated protein/ABC-type amino acid transport substrate-binding protein
MAYKMTGLTRGLLALIGLGVVASIGWNFYFKEKVGGKVTVSQSTTGQTSAPTSAGVTPKSINATSGKLGSATNPLRISIVSFHGYAPALIANGSSLKTAANSIYAKNGLNVEFVINDDIPTLTTLFESKNAQCAWRTADFWAQEHPNLRNAGHDGKAIMVVDNTQGGDAIISRDPAVQRIEDLAGKNVALLQYTPSHGMLIDTIENSSLTAKAKKQIKPIFIKADEGTAGVRAAFAAGNVDAAVLWDPDLSLALRDVKGSRVIYSSKIASNLIFDVIVCDQRELNKPENTEVFQKFVDGWLEGIGVAKANPDLAVEALVATEEFYKLLANKEGKPFVKSLFSNLVWTDLADNGRILGLAGSMNHYERVYTRFDQIYRAEGSLANPKSPVISAQDSFDYRFIKTSLQRSASAQAAAAQPAQTFTEQGKAAAMSNTAVLTKPVSVSFASGSSELSKRAQQIIDKEMVPFIENNGSAYFDLSGNTDAVGSASSNMQLSQLRAKAVADYLIKQWDIPRERLRVSGLGSTKPLCNEASPEAAGLSTEDCRALNRSTRLAVFAR